MQGHFDIFVQDAGGLKDEDFLKAEQEGRLGALLSGLPVDQEAHAKNTLTHMLTVSIFRRSFAHGFPNAAYPMERSNNIPLYFICILNTASEPAYTDWYGAYVSIHAVSGSVNTGNAGKRFIVHDLEYVIGTDPDGREAIFLQERWLYLPSQVVSSEIRSVGIYWSETVNDGNDEKGIVGRVRMKDAGGKPITLDKSASQTLLIQYTLTFVSL